MDKKHAQKSVDDPAINPRFTFYEPRGNYFLKISRAHYIALGGDRSLVAVWSALVYISNGLLRSRSYDDWDDDPWFEASLQKIHDVSLGVSERNIRECVDRLLGCGLLRTDDSTGKASRYLLDYEKMNSLVESNPGKFAGVKKSTTPANLPHTPAEIPGNPGKFAAPIKGIERSIEITEVSPIVPKPTSQTQPPSQEGLELYLGDSIIGERGRGFIADAYSRTKRPNPKLNTKSNERLCTQLFEAEEKYGAEQFRSELLRFLADESEDLQRAGWPLYFFLKRLERNGTGVVTQRTSQPSLLDNCPGLDNSPPPTQAPSEKQRLIALWNSAVPSRAFTDPERYLVLHHEHADLMEKFETLAKKAAAIVRHTPDSTWLNLRWLCGDKEGYPNWRKLLSGSLDFKAQQSRGGGKSTITVESMEQYFAEKKTKQEADKKSKEFLADVDLTANKF